MNLRQIAAEIGRDELIKFFRCFTDYEMVDILLGIGLSDELEDFLEKNNPEYFEEDRKEKSIEVK